MTRRKIVVVTGTDTDVGKTIFASCLVKALKADYWKPVQAGLEDGGDSATVAKLTGAEKSRIVPEAYRLTSPCSPHLAAYKDGLTITPKALEIPAGAKSLVVEGAGGVLVPLNGRLLLVDMLRHWNEPVVVVARTSLGTINHTLMTIEALRSRMVPLLGVAFNGDENKESELAIVKFSGVKRLGRLPWLPGLDPENLQRSFARNFDTKDFV